MERAFMYNLKWTTPKGFAASLTIQSDDLDELMEKAKGAMEKLVTANGHNGNGAAQASPPEHFCHEHQAAFKRYEKDGRAWWAHKAGNKWCREK